MNSPKEVYKKWVEQTNVSRNMGATDYFFDVADLIVCIRLHSQNLIKPFLSAIDHLRIHPCKADYIIDVWDCKNRELTFPPFDYEIKDVKLRGEIPNYSGDGIQFAYFAHARMVHVLNENTKHGIVALINADELPKFELACPFRAIFSWVLRNNGMSIIHAAALADSAGHTCLIMGKGGAGKSTTAISCYLAGMKYIGDDLCAIGIRDLKVYIFSIYSSGKTYRSEWQYMPELSRFATDYIDDDFDKEVYFFSNMPERTCRSGPLKTIFIPVKAGAFRPATPPPIASIINTTIESTKELLPDAGFESLSLLYAAFKQANVSLLQLEDNRQCPIPQNLI
jgi:hypothetical protein